MRISFSSDLTGFPLIHLSDLGFDVQLWPVTKHQFASFAGSNKTLNTIFEHASALNEAASKPGTKKPTARPAPQRIELEIMTGILPEEALQFAVWLDNEEPTSDYALPSVEEWRAVYDALQYERCDPYLKEIDTYCQSEPAQSWLHRILQTEPHTLLELSLMQEGVVEWVLDGELWVGLGRPNTAFYPNTFQPMQETVVPVDASQRMRMFGCRLIRVF